MSTITLEQIQWATLPDIDDVQPIGEKDHLVLRELRSVLIEHGYTDRFGITLLHRHFDLEEDEVLMESTDVEARKSVLTVEKHQGDSKTVIDTMWRFSIGGEPSAVTKCVRRCNYNSGHKNEHMREAH